MEQEIEKNDNSSAKDSEICIDKGLACLVLAARILGVPAEYQQMKRAYSIDKEAVDEITLLRAAKKIELKAKSVTVQLAKLPKLPLPAIARLKDGSYILWLLAV